MYTTLLSITLAIIGISLLVINSQKKQDEPTKTMKRSLAVVENGKCSDLEEERKCTIDFSFIVGSEKVLGTYVGPPFEGISSVKGGSVIALYNPDNPKDNTLLKPQANDKISNMVYAGVTLIIISLLVYLYL